MPATNISAKLDEAAIRTLDVALRLIPLHGRTDAVALIAKNTGATVTQVEALLDRAALIVCAA